MDKPAMSPVWIICLLGVASGALPPLPDCVPAQYTPFDSVNPINLFGVNHEIGIKATPQRVGNLRQKGPLPTGHFATGHIKNSEVWPMIVTPYQSLLTSDGATHDAYTMDRWNDPKRSDFMEQQTPSETGKPWNKLRDLGSNMKQMTTGPDGNPWAGFTGKSGVRVSIAGADEPEMTSFGELYANFVYRNDMGGSMEIPLVRGASLMTHIIKNANPVVKPFCLSSINGNKVNFDCPLEPTYADGGTGHLEGECHGSTLTVRLHNSKAITDLTKVQWAVEQKSNWGSTYMRNCDTNKCTLEDGGKTVRITIPNASGTMNYAVNYIGHYILPWDWTQKPMEAACTSKRGIFDIHMSATCQASRDLTITIDLGPESFPGLDKFQYAVQPANVWDSTTGYVPPMMTCTSAYCKHIGNTVVITTQTRATNYKLALNIITRRTFPASYWIEKPYEGVCDGSTITDVVSGTTNNNNNNNNPATTQTVVTTQPTQPPQTPKPATSSPAGSNTGSNPSYETIGLGTATKKFILELDEPGNDLPGVTRKFVLYFSVPVVPKIDMGSQTITFEPLSGQFSGLLQVGYTGSSQRGDASQTSFLDAYAGVYSYMPRVEYCVSKVVNKGFLSFLWNPVGVSGDSAWGRDLLMIAMPHHDLLMNAQYLATPFTFKGYVSNEWLMELPVLHTEIDPDPTGVAKIKTESSHLRDIHEAIERDASNHNLDAVCSHTDSYNGGKAIGMVTRLASLSRAFNTAHYTKLEESIRNCLEKWLRVQDSLEEMWKLHYDDVWGGLFLERLETTRSSSESTTAFLTTMITISIWVTSSTPLHITSNTTQIGVKHKDRIYALAKDVGNPSERDDFFPVSRQKDIYTGFSWASGLVPGTRQEESASEGINCYHGLAALGDAFGDHNMKQTGQILLAMEIHSVKEYWQVRPHNRDHFPPAIQDYGVVGMITEPDFYAYTLNWPCYPNIFPQRHGCLVGIQVIPITAVSKYWMDQEWAASIRGSCEKAIDPASQSSYHTAEKTQDLAIQLESGWKAFCHAAMAPLDSAHATAAANYVKDKRPQDLVGGTGAASTLLFIYART